jgi:polysaccharide export outer membrane protein
MSMKLHKVALSFLCLLLLLSGDRLKAQESLLIGPGDMVHVQVLDAPELEQHARITDSGDFPLLVGGGVHIAGLTPEQASAAIGKHMVDQHYLVNPRISVTVEIYATQNISIIGEVHAPGVYGVTTQKTVADALALAGGLLPDADRNVIIQRHGTGKLITYYSSNSPIVTPDSATAGLKTVNETTLRERDTMVNPGDTIRVARAEMVYAIGDFGRPGAFPIVMNDSQLTVLQLVALAGGANKTARLGHTRLVHKGSDGKLEEVQLSLGDMEKGKKPDQILQANDILYVPFSFGKNAALGAISLGAAATSAAPFAF